MKRVMVVQGLVEVYTASYFQHLDKYFHLRSWVRWNKFKHAQDLVIIVNLVFYTSKSHPGTTSETRKSQGVI